MNVQTALDSIAASAASGDIVFPTNAAIASRIQQLLDNPNCSADALGRLISAEPVLATRILSVANSAAYNPGGRSITELKGAIARLGFSAVRTLAVSVVIRQMKEMSPVPAHRALAARLWEHTAHVAALARVLARRVTHHNPEAAFLAGIVHEVGNFYLISRAYAFPGLLDGNLEIWHDDGEATVGRAVLKALDAPPTIRDAIEPMWSGFLAMPPVTLGDTLFLADELSPVESPLDAVTGMSRKGIAAEIEMLIDDEKLSEILEESADEVASLCNALKN